MKRIFTFIILTLVTCLNTVWAQPFHAWSIQNSGGTSQTLAGSVVNNQGHVFNYGIFSGTVDFDPGPNTANYTAVGTSDLFIQKLDASGNLLWLIRLGNYSATWNVYDIALDPVSGDILLTGRVFQPPTSQIDFNPGTGVAYVTGDNAFLLRLGTNGNFGFVRTWHHDVIFSALHVASNSDIYLGGYFASHNQGYYDMDPNAGSFSFSSFGANKDGFLIKLSSNSTFQWAKQLKSNNSAGLPVINGICTNTLNQNVFIVGRYSGSVIFRPTEAPLIVTTSAGFQDIFMQTFVSTNGDAYAVNSLGSTQDDAATAVITNGSTVYVGGYFGGTVNFDPGFSNTTLTSLGQSDVFLLRLTNFPPQTGANLSWVRRTGGTLNESLESLSLDAAGNVYSALNFNGSIDADPGAGTFTLTSAGQQDFAVQKIDQNGNFIWAVSVGSADYDLITSIHATNNDVYYSGKFSGTVDLNPTAGTQNFSTSGGFDSDIFTTRLSQCGDIPVISSNSPVCELSTINLEAPTIPGATYSWSGPGGYSSTAEDATRPNANGSHAGTYYLTVSVGTCVYPVASTQVQIASLYPIVSITPTNVSACSSGATPINFTSSLSTNAFPLSYQWQKDNVNIPGATSPSYSIASPTLADAGSYRLVVTTVCNTANSPSATVNIDPSAPVITTQPSPSALSVCQGGTLNLSAGATNGTITYQWQRNGSNIAGANSPTYSDPYVDLSEGGTYQLVASNACGSVTSQTVNVDVQFTVPSITTQPISQSICEGDNVTFSVIANYVSNYQWTKNGVNIPGATSANYSISAAQFTDAGNYAVVLSNGCGSVTSSVATLTVNGTTPIMITSQPQSVNICVGSSVTFTVLANGSIGSYQWRKNGVNIPGANSATYTIPSVTPSSAGSYDVVISSPCTGSVTSTAATLNVLSNTPVDNGLVFYLPFDGNTTEAINNTSSTGYYTYAAASDRFGNPNGAANFASNTFRTYNTYPGQPTGNSPYTISTWINVANGYWTSSNGICFWGTNFTNQTNALRLSNSGYVNYWWGNDFNVTIPPAQMQTGVWKHIVVTYDGTTQRFYENGVEIATRVPTTPANVASTVTRIGRAIIVSETFKGRLDDFRIYNRAITAAEVSNLYNYVPLTAASLPSTQSACAGSTFTQTVNVTGAELLTYQWYFNGNPLSDGGGISGTQTATLTISNVSAAHAGNYTVHVIQNGCVTKVSNIMALNIDNNSIAITTQPSNQTICENQPLNLSVTATGTGLTYQWTLNGNNILGATSATYSVASATVANAGNYQVVVSNTACSLLSNVVSVTVNTTAPSQPAAISGTTTVCQGSTQTYSVSPVSGATSYTWTLPSGWTGSSTTNSITTTAGTSGGNITVTANNACGSSTPQTLAVVVNPGAPAQPSAITGNTTVCENSIQTYSIAAVSGATSYTWTLPNGWTGSSTSDTIQVTAGSNGGIITVTADNGCGSSAAQTLAITVNTVPSQPGAISGTTTVCQGSTQTYSVAAVPGATSYTWNLPSGWTGSSTTNSISATVGANSGNITVTANNACGSSVAQSLAITVNPLPLQPTFISGNASVCANTTQTYSVSSVGATSYTWTLPSGWTGSSTTNNITAAVGTSGGTITVVANNACGSSTPTSLAVVVNSGIPAQPSAITGNTTVCENSIQTYSIAAVSGATSYTWTLPNGWTGSSTSDTIQVTAGPNGGTITVTADNGCGSSAAQSIAISVNPLPAQPGAISGTTSLCEGTTQTYSIAAVPGATSYTWTLPNGWTGSSTTDNITVTVGANSGNVSVTADNACGSSTPQTLAITVTPLPEQPAVINGAASVCENTTQTYSVSSAGATSYTWTIPNGWTGSSTTDSITATVGTSGGTITVVANNTCGSSNATSLAVVVSATAPLQPSAIIGDTIVCENSTEIYSVSSAGATSYTWTLPNGWTGNSTSDTIQVAVDSIGGTITVIAHNGCGSSPAQSIYITVNALPNVTANASATSVCQGSQVILTGSGATSYTWDNGVTNGVAFAPTSTTTYTVTGTDANGCSNTAQITITVNPLPNVTVSNNANTLTVNQAGATYQWIDCNNNNAPISGATNQSFTPTTGGSYAVVVTLNGCVDTSACQTVTIAGIDTAALTKQVFSIYPNPNRGNFTIQGTKGGVFELIDVTGKVINTYTVTNTQQTVNENIPAGIYFVREKESGTIQKLIVQ